jgi:hypothetical protein
MDDVAAVHDLVTHIDGSAVDLEGQFHDLDRPIHAGAEPSGVGEVYLHRSSFLMKRETYPEQAGLTIRQNRPRRQLD